MADIVYDITKEEMKKSRFSSEILYAVSMGVNFEQFPEKMILIVKLKKSGPHNIVCNVVIKNKETDEEINLGCMFDLKVFFIVMCEEAKNRREKLELENKLSDLQDKYTELLYRSGNPGMEEAKKEFDESVSKLEYKN